MAIQFVIPSYQADLAVSGAADYQLAKNLSMTLYLLGIGAILSAFAGVTNLFLALGASFDSALSSDIEAKIG